MVYNRRFAARFVEAFSLALILVLSAHAQVSPELPNVSVELSIRLPDGRPLVHAGVVIKIFGGSPFQPRISDVHVTTDNRGVARYEIPAGAYSMSVTVHKVGQGNVGMTEFIPGRVARLSMPPLAGYGSIDVIVPSGCGNDFIVRAGSEEEHAIPPGSANPLHIDDLPAGKLSVSAAINSGPQSWLYDPCSDYGSVNVVPGQNLRVVLRPPPADLTVPKRPDSTTANTLIPRAEGTAQKEPIVWVHGIVRDEAGKPISTASVYAVATYYGGIRMNGFTIEATTDTNGYYEIKGEDGLSSLAVTLLTAAPGHPPAWA